MMRLTQVWLQSPPIDGQGVTVYSSCGPGRNPSCMIEKMLSQRAPPPLKNHIPTSPLGLGEVPDWLDDVSDWLGKVFDWLGEVSDFG